MKYKVEFEVETLLDTDNEIFVKDLVREQMDIVTDEDFEGFKNVGDIIVTKL